MAISLISRWPHTERLVRTQRCLYSNPHLPMFNMTKIELTILRRKTLVVSYSIVHIFTRTKQRKWNDGLYKGRLYSMPTNKRYLAKCPYISKPKSSNSVPCPCSSTIHNYDSYTEIRRILPVALRSMGRAMLEVTLRDQNCNAWIRKRTQDKDDMAVVTKKADMGRAHCYIGREALDKARMETQIRHQTAWLSTTALDGQHPTKQILGLDESGTRSVRVEKDWRGLHPRLDHKKTKRWWWWFPLTAWLCWHLGLEISSLFILKTE